MPREDTMVSISAVITTSGEILLLSREFETPSERKGCFPYVCSRSSLVRPNQHSPVCGQNPQCRTATAAVSNDASNTG